MIRNLRLFKLYEIIIEKMLTCYKSWTEKNVTYVNQVSRSLNKSERPCGEIEVSCSRKLQDMNPYTLSAATNTSACVKVVRVSVASISRLRVMTYK